MWSACIIFSFFLGGNNVILGSNARLPTNNEALQLFSLANVDSVTQTNESQAHIEDGETQIMINKIYVTLWSEGRKNQWYLGYCVNCNDDGTFTMDHMHRVKKTCNVQWKYPDVPDTCNVKVDQILTIRPAGNWDSDIFSLCNADHIKEEFQKTA